MLFDFFRRKSYRQFSDEALLELCRESEDHEALGVLYDRHLEMVFQVCNRYLENEDLAKDAVLDIFEQLCVKIKLHDIQHFGNWLYILTKNHCLMQLRKKKQRIIVPIDDAGQLNEATNLDEQTHDEKEQEIKLLESCLQSLPAKQMTAVTLFYLESKSYLEVAEIMGEDRGIVRSYIQNGRRNLKICMGSKRY